MMRFIHKKILSIAYWDNFIFVFTNAALFEEVLLREYKKWERIIYLCWVSEFWSINSSPNHFFNNQIYPYKPPSEEEEIAFTYNYTQYRESNKRKEYSAWPLGLPWSFGHWFMGGPGRLEFLTFQRGSTINEGQLCSKCILSWTLRIWSTYNSLPRMSSLREFQSVIEVTQLQKSMIAPHVAYE